MQSYEVQVRRVDARHVEATTRDFVLMLGAKRGDLTAGLNPVETLLSAMGSCLLTALQMVAELSQVSVSAMAMRLVGTRQDKPPKLVTVTYTLWIESPVPQERLERLVQTAAKNSTVYQTLTAAVAVSGTVEKGRPPESL